VQDFNTVQKIITNRGGTPTKLLIE